MANFSRNVNPTVFLQANLVASCHLRSQQVANTSPELFRNLVRLTNLLDHGMEFITLVDFDLFGFIQNFEIDTQNLLTLLFLFSLNFVMLVIHILCPFNTFWITPFLYQALELPFLLTLFHPLY
jgi:hypothetical protein